MNDCEHNDHGHLLIWIVLFLLSFNSSFVDCSGDRRRLEDRVQYLESKVRYLESHQGK